MIKGSILQEYKTITNLYAPDNKDSKHTKQNWEEAK